MMNGKHIKIAKAVGHHQWGLRIEDGLGVTYAWATLTPAIVAALVEQINAAAEAGAPWQKVRQLVR